MPASGDDESIGLIFQPKPPPRQVKRVRVARDGQPVSCDVIAVVEGWAAEPRSRLRSTIQAMALAMPSRSSPPRRLSGFSGTGSCRAFSRASPPPYRDARGNYICLRSRQSNYDPLAASERHRLSG